jgi:hypothetical protein
MRVASQTSTDIAAGDYWHKRFLNIALESYDLSLISIYGTVSEPGDHSTRQHRAYANFESIIDRQSGSEE